MILSKISLPVNHDNMRHLICIHKEASSRIRAEASYMAETAVALPFFAGFAAALLFFFQALCVQQEVGGALLAAGRELSVLECEADKSSTGGNMLLAKTMLVKNLKKDSAAERFVKGGRMGISLANSDFSGHYIRLQADYRMRLGFGLFGRQELCMTQRLTCRKWTGESFAKEDEIVYIAKSGSVYHRKRGCSYLSPSVMRADGEISKLRNASGGKYYPCEKCMKGKKARNKNVYITKYGNRYHGNKTCSEIARTAIAARLAEVKDRKACSKCGREEES